MLEGSVLYSAMLCYTVMNCDIVLLSYAASINCCVMARHADFLRVGSIAPYRDMTRCEGAARSCRGAGPQGAPRVLLGGRELRSLGVLPQEGLRPSTLVASFA